MCAAGQSVKLESSNKLKEVQNVILMEAGTGAMKEVLTEVGYIVLIAATGILNVDKVGKNTLHFK